MHVSKNPPLASSISSELADLVTEAEKVLKNTGEIV
jgi:ElaB/YqjD/DUF883 family membrane-anchored ribosome-binding protein